MIQYRICVTNISHAINVLVQNGYKAINGGSYVEFKASKESKMEVVLLLNKHNVVVYDIEEQ